MKNCKHLIFRGKKLRAPSEDRTHDLQIARVSMYLTMRLTRYLLRYRGHGNSAWVGLYKDYKPGLVLKPQGRGFQVHRDIVMIL